MILWLIINGGFVAKKPKCSRAEKQAARDKFLSNLSQAASVQESYYDRLMGYLRLDVVFKDNPAFATKTSIKKLTSKKVDFDFNGVQDFWNSEFANAKAGDKPKVTKSKILSAEYETILFLQLNYFKSKLATIVQSLQDNPRKLNEDELKEALFYGEAVKTKRDALVVANLGLVYAMASRFNFGTLDRRGKMPSASVEIISEGISGLMKAVDRFDIGRGFKFSTYGCDAIIKAMSRYRSKQIKQNTREVLPRDYTVEKAIQVPEFADFIGDIKNILDANKAKLTESEKAVIQNRFFEDKKLYEIAEELNLSKERVRQIEIKALYKLKRAMGINPYEV